MSVAGSETLTLGCDAELEYGKDLYVGASYLGQLGLNLILEKKVCFSNILPR